MLLLLDLDDTLYSRTEQLSDDLSEIKDIKLFQEVKEFLTRKDFVKVLVSKGDSELQMKKLYILGIKDLFDKILICSNNKDKETCFKESLLMFPEEKEVFVIGNRIDSEISYGNRLGLKTIHLSHGKYKDLKAENIFEIPDYSYKTFSEIIEGHF